MNEKLQQAISAARNGQETEAQKLLTQLLQENPNETQAWFLLGTLVDSEQKKFAYLGKVLALEPDHAMARKMLASLRPEVVIEAADEEMEAKAGVVPEWDEPEMEEEEEVSPEPAVVSLNTSDFLAQQKGDTLPAWLIEEEGLEIFDGEAAVEAEAGIEISAGEDESIPDWLKDEVPESWSEQAPVEETVVAKADLPGKKEEIKQRPKPLFKSAAGTDNKKQYSFLTGILYALVAVAVVTFIILIYLAWGTFF